MSLPEDEKGKAAADAHQLTRVGTLVELYTHVRDGGRLEVRSRNGWTLAHPYDYLPTIEDDLTGWRKQVIPRRIYMMPEDVPGPECPNVWRHTYAEGHAPEGAIEFVEVLK